MRTRTRSNKWAILLFSGMLLASMSACSDTAENVASTGNDALGPTTSHESEGDKESNSPSGPSHTITYQALDTEDHFAGEAQSQVASAVDNATDGTVQFDITFAGGLGVGGAEMLRSIGDGVIDAGMMWGGQVIGDFPNGAVMELPFLVPGDAQLRRDVANEIRPIWAKELREDYNVELLGTFQVEPRNLYTSKPVSSREDIQGLSIRALGSEAEFTSTLGGTAVNVDYNELYTSLEQGVVDGFWVTHSAVVDRSFYEVANHAWELQQGGGTAFIIMNSDVFGELDAGQQEAVRAATANVVEQTQTEVVPAVQQEFRDILINDHGMEMTEPTEDQLAGFVEDARPIWEDWAESNGERAKELLDIVQSTVQGAS